MNIFLSPSEIADLTGYIIRSKQSEWLDKRGWKYEVSSLGQVKVLRRYAEMQLGMPTDDKTTQTEPDFSSLAT